MTGITTLISAGSNITVTTNAGITTISSTGGGVGVGTTNISTNSLVVSGVSTFQGDVRLLDDDQLSFGNDNDTKITHDENNTTVNHTGTGRFIVRAGIGSTVAVEKDGLNPIANFTPGGSVDLYHDGTKRFETTNEGVLVSGGTTTVTLSVSGVSTVGVVTGATYYGDASNITHSSLSLIHI